MAKTKLSKEEKREQRVKALLQDHHDEIHALRKSGNKDAMIDLAIKLGRQATQRFYRLEKAGVAEESLAYQWAKKELGKDKPYYTRSRAQLANLSEKDLSNYLLKLNQKIISPSSLIEGQRSIHDKAFEAAVDALKSRRIYVREEQKEDFARWLANGGAEILAKQFYDSDQVIHDWELANKRGISNEEFNEYHERFIAQQQDMDDVDVGEFRRQMTNLAARKRYRRAHPKK